jgi:hypothetical protein
MWFKHRAWIPVAWLLSLANLVSVWFAARPGEPGHATAHALLAVLFGLGAQRLAARQASPADTGVADRLQELEWRLTELDTLPEAERRLPELEERLDFIERALVDVRNRAHLPRQE